MFVEYARNAAPAAPDEPGRSRSIPMNSIGLGEDGPTHQAVEQLASLRLTPNFSTWRPCDQVGDRNRLAGGYRLTGRADGADPVATKPAQMPRTPEQVRISPGWLRA